MPNMGGIEATRRMKGHCPKAVVLVLTAHEDEGLMLEALRAGAAGYVLKVDSLRTLPRVRPRLGRRRTRRQRVGLGPPWRECGSPRGPACIRTRLQSPRRSRNQRRIYCNRTATRANRRAGVPPWWATWRFPWGLSRHPVGGRSMPASCPPAAARRVRRARGGRPREPPPSPPISTRPASCFAGCRTSRRQIAKPARGTSRRLRACWPPASTRGSTPNALPGFQKRHIPGLRRRSREKASTTGCSG